MDSIRVTWSGELAGSFKIGRHFTQSNLQFRISDFEMQDAKRKQGRAQPQESSNFEIPHLPLTLIKPAFNGRVRTHDRMADSLVGLVYRRICPVAFGALLARRLLFSVLRCRSY